MEINEYLVKLFTVIKDVESLDLFAFGARFSKTEFRLLREVVLEGEKGKRIISSELSKRLGVTRSAVSQIVTKFENENVLKRVASPTDRKIAYIELSDEAYAVFEEQCKQANKLMDEVAKRYGKDRLQQLIDDYDAFVRVFSSAKKELFQEERSNE